MCGIAGKVSADGAVDRSELERMCEALRHRGPDSRGTHLREGVGLGIRRLAIIDLVHGDQPFYTEDGNAVLVLNGEVYNHEELRSELVDRGHRFVSSSDAEVVVHLWEEMGDRCVDRLRGMFAFALWDGRRRQLFLARDRIGKKPLYWTRAGHSLLFGSEPRALLQSPDVSRDVDLGAIDAFLVNQYVPHARCAHQDLRKLPPGSTLSWTPGQGEPSIQRYWRLGYRPKLPVGDPQDGVERLRAEVLEATRLRLRSDVPLGAFLSGGVDSSLVVAAMARTLDGPVKTFSATFPGTAVDESHYARLVARRYGTEHHELEVGPPDPEILPRLAWHFGEPFADPAALPTYQLSELVRRHVTVALNGDGGDESFFGYRRYGQLVRTLKADLAPFGVRRGAAVLLARAAGTSEGRAPLPRAARLARRLALPPSRRYADLFRFFSDRDRERLYTPHFAEAARGSDPLHHTAQAWDEHEGLAPEDRLMATDVETYLADDLVAKVDITSMAHSVEVRSPLLDTELMGWAARLPPAVKGRVREPKRLLRQAARGWIDDAILDRPKQGFAVPIADWLRGPLSSVCRDVLLDDQARDRGLFVPREVERMVRDHQDGVLDYSERLWAMLMLELWFQTCVDRSVARYDDLPTLI